MFSKKWRESSRDSAAPLGLGWLPPDDPWRIAVSSHYKAFPPRPEGHPDFNQRDAYLNNLAAMVMKPWLPDPTVDQMVRGQVKGFFEVLESVQSDYSHLLTMRLQIAALDSGRVFAECAAMTYFAPRLGAPEISDGSVEQARKKLRSVAFLEVLGLETPNPAVLLAHDAVSSAAARSIIEFARTSEAPVIPGLLKPVCQAMLTMNAAWGSSPFRRTLCSLPAG